MKQYEKYKDSGIDWLGNIPEHWEAFYPKYYLTLCKGKNPKVLIQDEIKDPYLTMDYLRGRDNKMTFYPKNTEGLVWVDNDELLILWDGANAGEIIKSKKGYLSSTMALISFDNKHLRLSYLYYFLKANERIFKDFSSGTTIPHFDSNILLEQKYAFPTISEQQVIAEYLDYTVGKIDNLISEKEELVKKLEEKRKSIINEVITGGLNPDVKMRDSGIEWLGEIPEHWKISKIKYLADLKSGTNLTSEQINTVGNFPVYGGNGLRGYYHLFSDDGDYVLIGRQGALCGNVNYAKGKFWATEHAVICYPKTDFKTIWFGELLRSMNLNQYSIASAQPGLAVERIKNLGIPYPSIEEQIEIVNYIESRTLKLDKLISEINTQIEKLKEYKISVISEAVTGKIDLREWQTPKTN